MIDIHCHILPGLDDGPGDVEEALAMARMAVKDGVRSIIATPHCYDGVYNCQDQDIAAACLTFNNVLRGEKIGLTVFPGAEVRLTPELPTAIEHHRVQAWTGRSYYLLLELPEMFIVEGVIRIIKLLCMSGVRCILAHPERNTSILAKRDVLDSLIAAGAEMQVTGGSLLGDFGRDSKELAYYILQLPVISYIASDGHCSRRRKPILAKALKAAAKFIGHERAAGLVSFGLDEELLSSHQYACNQ